jgi:hypothetical protein
VLLLCFSGADVELSFEVVYIVLSFPGQLPAAIFLADVEAAVVHDLHNYQVWVLILDDFFGLTGQLFSALMANGSAQREQGVHGLAPGPKGCGHF